MTPTQAKRQRRQLAREIAAELRKKDRAELEELRKQIKDATRHRDERRRAVSAGCRFRRLELRETARKIRAEHRAEARREIERLRAQARQRCDAEHATAKRESTTLADEARAALKAERKHQRDVKRSLRKTPGTRKLVSAKERKAESDDAVRRNLEPALVAVFNKVRKQIKAGPRRSRTEAFLEWAAENPGEVLRLQSDAAELDVARLVRAEKEHAKAMKSRTRYKKPAKAMLDELRKSRLSPEGERLLREMRAKRRELSAAELAQLAEDVPF